VKTEHTYTLSELQAMTREELETAFPQGNAGGWKQKLGYKVSINPLIRAIILAAKKEHWVLADNKGCRELWYNPVKPILLKADPERVNKHLKHSYMAIFENVLAQMVKAGILTYADLGVNDFRTMRETCESVEHAKCWKDILLFVEKDSAYVHLVPLKNLFNINIISGGGWGHVAGIERMLRDLKQDGINEVVVFTVTDWDPFGFAIAEEFVQTCGLLGLYVKEHHRIGVNPEHATPEILEVQKYPIDKGRNLTVNGISFNSDRWLAEHGIDREYGLEIEAISGQPKGHQFLREIVAKELLNYLRETDRVEEVTNKAWENLPFSVIQNIMILVDNQITPRELIDVKPEEKPSQYLWYTQFAEQFNALFEEMEEESSGINDQIADLESDIEALEEEKAEIEGPYRNSLGILKRDYRLSRNILVWCLHQYYLKHKEQWPRQNYDLGFPKGCLIKAIQEQRDLGNFIKQVDTTKPSTDISNFLTEAYNNGEVKKLIEVFFKEGEGK